MAGRYKLRFSAYSFWAGPGKGPKWWIPDRADTSKGRTTEPVVVWSELPPRQTRTLGRFDVNPEPGVYEVDVWLLKGETIGFDAARLFRSRPPNWHNPLATREGCPGVAVRWMEAEGPILDQWPPAGPRAALRRPAAEAGAGRGGDRRVEPARGGRRAAAPGIRPQGVPPAGARGRGGPIPAGHPGGAGLGGVLRRRDVCRIFGRALLAGVPRPDRVARPARRPRPGRPPVVLPLELAAGSTSFAGWPIAGRSAIRRRSARRSIACSTTRRPAGSWTPSSTTGSTSGRSAIPRRTRPCIPDYYLDDLLADSAVEETRLYFAEMLRADLPARVAVASDFTFLNDRLAEHYGLPAVGGSALRRTALAGRFAPRRVPDPGQRAQGDGQRDHHVAGPPRGLGDGADRRQAAPPAAARRAGRRAGHPRGDRRSASSWRSTGPSPSAPSATRRSTRRASRWRASTSSAGSARRYRALSETDLVPGFGKNGQPFKFRAGPAVDPSATLPDGRTFHDVRELKRLLLADERQIARNLVGQLVTYATGDAGPLRRPGGGGSASSTAPPRAASAPAPSSTRSSRAICSGPSKRASPAMTTPAFASNRRPVSRRAFLRGAGVALSLPMLDVDAAGVRPRGRTRRRRPRRMFGICNNLGLLPDEFFPAQASAGRDYKPSPYLEVLKDHRDDFTVFSGVMHPDVDGGHPADNCFLTAAPHPGNAGFRNTISLDQYAAERVGHLTRFPSLTLGVNVARGQRSLSWTGTGRPDPLRGEGVGRLPQAVPPGQPGGGPRADPPARPRAGA